MPPPAGPRTDRRGSESAPTGPWSRRRRRTPALCRRRWGCRALERLLELAMARARAEQDGDIARAAGRATPVCRSRTRVLAQDPRDLVRHARAAHASRIARRDHAEHAVTRRGFDGWSIDGNRSSSVVGEVVRPRRASGRDLGEEVVDELRAAPAPRGSCARSTAADSRPAERLDEARRLLQHGDLGVAEAVDRLLAVADDEDRRLRRRGRALRPRTGPAARPAPTARGSCPGTRRRARGDSAPRAGSGSARTRPSGAAARAPARARRRSRGPIDRRASCGIARAPSPNIRRTPRASTTLRSRLNLKSRSSIGRAELEHRGAMTLSCRLRRIVGGLVRLDRRRSCAAYPPAGEKVQRDAVERGANLGVPARRAAGQPAQLPRQELVARMAGRAVGEKPLADRPGRRRAERAQRDRRHGGRRLGVRSGGPSGEEAIERRPRRPAGDRAATPALRACARCRAARTRARRPARCGPAASESAATDRAPLRSSRGTSVSSAMSKPGSRSASSGNSRSSDRQKASIVLIAISPRRSRSSTQRARSSSDARAAARSSGRMRSRISAAALRVKVIARMFAGSTRALSRLM